MNQLFPELLAPKLHPANVGHDFTREGAVTPALLELYRARQCGCPCSRTI